MEMYTIIFFYSNGSTDIHEAGSITSATAIEAGALESWYETAMRFPNVTKKCYLTGIVIINNRRHDVIENKTYVKKGGENNA